MPRNTKPTMTAPTGPIAQVKIRLLGISPMIRWRLLVIFPQKSGYWVIWPEALPFEG